MLSPVPALLSAKRAAAPTLGRVLAGTLAGGVGGGLIGSALGGDPLRGATQGAAMLGAHGLTARAFKPKPVDPAHRPDLALPGVGQAHVLPKIDMTGVRVPRPRPVTVVQNGKPLSTDDRIYLIPSFENGPTVGGLAGRATKMREQTALSAGAAVRDRARDVAERYRTQQQLLIDSQREREVLDAIRTNASNRELVQQAAKANTQRLQGLSDQLAEAHGRSAGLTAGLASAYLAGKGYDASQGQPPVKPEPKKAAELALAVLTKSAVYPGAPGGPAQGYSWGAPSQWATGSGPLGAPQETGVQAKLKALHDRWVEHGDPVAKQQLDAIQQRMAGLTGFSAGGGQPGQTGQTGQPGQPIPPELLRYRALQRRRQQAEAEFQRKKQEAEATAKSLQETPNDSPGYLTLKGQHDALLAQKQQSERALAEAKAEADQARWVHRNSSESNAFNRGLSSTLYGLGLSGSSNDRALEAETEKKYKAMLAKHEALYGTDSATSAQMTALKSQMDALDAARRAKIPNLTELEKTWDEQRRKLDEGLGALTQQYEGLDEYDTAHSNMQAAMAALGKDRHDELAQQEYQAARQNMTQLMQQYKTRQRPAAPMAAVGGGRGSTLKPPVHVPTVADKALSSAVGSPPVPPTPPPAMPPAQGVSAHGIGGGVGSLPTPMPGPSGGVPFATGGKLPASDRTALVKLAYAALKAAGNKTKYDAERDPRETGWGERAIGTLVGAPFGGGLVPDMAVLRLPNAIGRHATKPLRKLLPGEARTKEEDEDAEDARRLGGAGTLDAIIGSGLLGGGLGALAGASGVIPTGTQTAQLHGDRLLVKNKYYEGTHGALLGGGVGLAVGGVVGGISDLIRRLRNYAGRKINRSLLGGKGPADLLKEKEELEKLRLESAVHKSRAAESDKTAGFTGGYIGSSDFSDLAQLAARLMVQPKAAGSVVPVALGITAGQRRPEASPIPIIPPDKDDVSPDGLSRAEQVMAALNAGKIRKKKKKPAVTAE